jgi:hypothetical protein
MMATPLPLIPHYPNFYGRERLLNVNHCCCCQSSVTKALHPANLKTTAEDSDCHSSSSGFSDSPCSVKSSKVNQFPVYKANNCKNKESKNVVHRPVSAIWAVLQENVLLLIVLGGSLMFNAVMLYLMAAGKGTGLFAS